MPTTSNFGWTTPADTDLVKDGAAAIRTLGNGIDTSFLDLKGGTTGQVLSKATNTDLDYTWITPNVGDLTEVQAGTGISVASGTGPIPVVTNTVATAFDAKGDLVAGTGADTFARLAVGANNTVLTADSTTATGLKWSSAAPSNNWTLITSGTSTTGSSVALAVSGYDRYRLVFNIYSATTGVTMKFRFNNLSATNYTYGAFMSGATTTQTNVDGINLDNFSTFNEQPCGFLEINNANTGTKPQFFGSWRRANNANNNLINYSGIYNANITLSSIDLVSTATISDFTYRLWGL